MRHASFFRLSYQDVKAVRVAISAGAVLGLIAISACADNQSPSITAPRSLSKATVSSGGFANAGKVTICVNGVSTTFTAAYMSTGQVPSGQVMITGDTPNHTLLTSGGAISGGSCFDVYASTASSSETTDTYAHILLTVATPGGYTLTSTVCTIDNGLVQPDGTPYANGDFGPDCDNDGDAAVYANFYHGSVVTFTFSPIVTGNNCTYTQGYYKNHESYTASVLSSNPSTTYINASGLLMIGAYTLSAAQVDAILGTPVGKGYNSGGVVFSKDQLGMIHQLITAELNIAGGASPTSISATIAAANAGYTTASKSQLSAWTTALDNFNEGITGPGHCGDQIVVIG